MPTRTIRPGRRGLRGSFPSAKARRLVAYESRLERDHLLLLEADPSVHAFEEQPVSIHFVGRRGPRRYTPDARVEFGDGRIEIREIKYTSDLAAMDADERAAFEEAQAAAVTYCEGRGWRFRLVTEREIAGPKLARAQVLRKFSVAPGALATLGPAIEARVRRAPGISLGALTAALGAPDGHACVLHLLWRGSLAEEPVCETTITNRSRDNYLGHFPSTTAPAFRRGMDAWPTPLKELQLGRNP